MRIGNVDRFLMDQIVTGALTITWINHVSLLAHTNLETLRQIDGIGVDGTLLRRLIRHRLPRSSADLVLPDLFKGSTLRVGLVGGDSYAAVEHGRIFTKEYPSTQLAWSIPGMASVEDIATECMAILPRVDVLVVGTGSPKQDALAVELSRRCTHKCLIVTCGGWLDQLGVQNYYPWWAYPLRLNWLVRLVREPQRLWRRYTVDAAIAVGKRRQIRGACRTLEHRFI